MPSTPQLLILAISILLPLLIFGPIARKAGFSIWWSLLMLLPLINIAVVWIFAFIKWPVEERD